MRSFAIVVLMLLLPPAVPVRFSLLALGQGTGRQFGGRSSEQSPLEQRVERDRVRAMNKERQQKLKQDTDKLFQLASELKSYVDKTNENVLSLEVLKKTDEIEKLSKSIREKMKTAYDVPQDTDIRPR